MGVQFFLITVTAYKKWNSFDIAKQNGWQKAAIRLELFCFFLFFNIGKANRARTDRGADGTA